VAVDWIEETTPDSIRLRCTRNKLATLQPFIEHRRVRGEHPRVKAWPTGWGVVAPERETVEYKHIPRGELAVHRAAKVRALDGRVGRMEKFLVDPRTQHITHLVVRKGHLWNRKDVTLPIAALGYFGEDTVYLKLDKHTINPLPGVPVRRRHT
jgi:hypothetical protein